MTLRSKMPAAAGFTLIELMVTILVASILLGIAVPSYQSQIRKSRRTEARTAILDLATREERYYSVNNSYSSSALDLGYGATAAAITNLTVGNGYYQVTGTNVAANGTTQASFKVVATTFGTQVKDTQCNTFTVDQTGTQSSTAVGGANSTSSCWT